MPEPTTKEKIVERAIALFEKLPIEDGRVISDLLTIFHATDAAAFASETQCEMNATLLAIMLRRAGGDALLTVEEYAAEAPSRILMEADGPDKSGVRLTFVPVATGSA